MMHLLQGILLPAALLLSGLAPSLHCSNLVAAKKDAPGIRSTSFETPQQLFYFPDSEAILLTEADGMIWRSANAGRDFKKVEDIPYNEVESVTRNPNHDEIAIAIGRKNRHWITEDRGESWRQFEIDAELPALEWPVSFHAKDPQKMLWHGDDLCLGWTCIGSTYYTTDGFKTYHKLIDRRKTCMFAKSTPEFTTGDEKADDDRVVCIIIGQFSDETTDYRIVISDKYFKDGDMHEPPMDDGTTVGGFSSLAAAKSFIVGAARAEGSDELALYVTHDTNDWHRAEFPEHRIEEDGYTLLESTNYSVQVDVMTTVRGRMGVLFTSNSDGKYFTKNIEHTNRNEFGYVDFEKVSNVQGVVLVNVVDNWEEVSSSNAKKQVISKISFDDGRTFQSLKCKGDKCDGEELHLHSVTDVANSGRVFSSPAPGLIMGVGNTGKKLEDYNKGDLWVSDDGGVSWTHALEEAHKYEFGDQGAVLVAIYDEGETDSLRYSLNHGKDWEEAKLGDKVRAVELTTIPDSTSLQFVLRAEKGSGKSKEFLVYSLDFSELHEGKCKDKDFEMWQARDGECVMGRKQSFRRRKANADCFVDEEFKDPVPVYEPCKCTELDYECDFGFEPQWEGEGEDKKKSCVPSRALTPPQGSCKKEDDIYKGPSGWRKIPGNQCQGGVELDKETERSCSETKRPISTGEISVTQTDFDGAASFREWYYLERSKFSQGDDETIVMTTNENDAYITHDHGKSWEKAVDDRVVAIYPHSYYKDNVYFITDSETVYYSDNRGLAIHTFEAPESPTTQSQILKFHPKYKDWLIWVGEKCDKSDCHNVAHVSLKGGEDWETLLRYVEKCEFMWRGSDWNVNENLVFCEQYAKEDISNPRELVSSEDWFEHKKTEFSDVVDFATMSEFIVVATRNEEGTYLKVDASVDGKTFADAKFPPKSGFEPHAYTVLDSSTHSVFLHVTVNSQRKHEYGSIVKSNSNGTSYVLSIDNVNRNGDGFVDFEKMQNLEGVAIANVVANREEVDKGGDKQKRTVITHNDGAEWDLIKPPTKDSEGAPYPCSGKSLEKCALHLHGYTERSDPRETFFSQTAVGLIMGVGNVGEYLTSYEQSNTFLSTDGGITWKEIMKGPYAFEYGDQGSIIVLVSRTRDTNEVFYSTDEGNNWKKKVFSDKKVRVQSITTLPSDTSKNFLLWVSKDNGKLATINLDFSGLFDRNCENPDEHKDTKDYYLWEPKHPNQEDNCLFGHVARYHRKTPGTECWNGMNFDNFEKLHEITRNCTCTRSDFECDYNYERANDGSCQLVPGLAPPDPKAVCAKKDVFEYYEVTGYRKIPISTCTGGKELDLTAGSKPCPGHEEEYERKRGTSGWAIFFAIVIPFALAGGIGWWVYRSWDGKFGRIRLGETGPSFDSDAPWIRYPVIAISGIVAVVAAIPMVAEGLWRTISSRFGGGRFGYGGPTYTSRSSFARGRGEYAVVDPDEGELLGEDSEEEV